MVSKRYYVKKLKEYRTFTGFKVNEEVYYSLLHFADDTILVGEGSWKNVWAIRAILRDFEMVSSLRINI